MDQSLNNFIQKHDSVLILLPSSARFDEVAAGLSLYLSLSENKQVSVTSSDPMRVEFNRLVGVNRVTQEIGNKNLVIKFMNYKADNIEKVSYDIENGQFKLTVVPKQGQSSPQTNQVEMSYSGFSGGGAIAVGGANVNQFPVLGSEDMKLDSIIHIGTKELSGQTDNIMSLVKPSSSVSELVYDHLKQSGVEVNSDAATNLIMGIEEGSDNFSDNNVTADTFQVIADLMKKGGKRAPKPESQDNFPPGSIPGQKKEVEEQKEEKKIEKQQKQEKSGSQVKSQQQPQQEKKQQNDSDAVKSIDESPPKSWLEPKIFKGTSIK